MQLILMTLVTKEVMDNFQKKFLPVLDARDHPCIYFIFVIQISSFYISWIKPRRQISSFYHVDKKLIESMEMSI